MKAKMQNWDDVRERYLGLSPSYSSMANEMLQLVDYISNSSVSECIYPWTSMFDLCITQSHQSPYEGAPHLKISPQNSGKIEFRYIDTHKNEKQWSRIAELGCSIKRFDKFIDQMHWVVKAS